MCSVPYKKLSNIVVTALRNSLTDYINKITAFLVRSNRRVKITAIFIAYIERLQINTHYTNVEKEVKRVTDL